jgi:hypothetical protein
LGLRVNEISAREDELIKTRDICLGGDFNN